MARPAGAFEGQGAVPAPQIRHPQRRQQAPQRPRPGRPAASRHEAPFVAELLLALAAKLLEPGVVLRVMFDFEVRPYPAPEPLQFGRPPAQLRSP